MTAIGVVLLLAAAAIPALARAARILGLAQRTARDDSRRPAPTDLMLPEPREHPPEERSPTRWTATRQDGHGS